MDVAIGHVAGGEEENYPPMGHQLQLHQQHAQGHVAKGGPGGFTMMMRRQPRHGRRQRSREQDKQSLAVVSRRHGHGYPPSGPTTAEGDQVPPPIFLTSQLQQNVMRQIETEHGADAGEAGTKNAHTAAVSRLDARRQRLVRGLPP